MKIIVRHTDKLHGKANVPPSKSHTHRAIILASLASGISIIRNPLKSADCLSTMKACQAIGAQIKTEKTSLLITGVKGKPKTPDEVIDVGNSGTTLRFMSAIVAHCNGKVILTGDESIQQRPIEPLLRSLNDLGAKAIAIRENGRPPIAIQGILKGGKTTMNGISSQFLSGILISCPIAASDSEIHVVKLKSKPYIDMTLQHLKDSGVTIYHDKYSLYHIPKRQIIRPRQYIVPADYSSAAFLLAAANITKSNIDVVGLDKHDVQGDKIIRHVVKEMEAGEHREIDLGNAPDLLPITAVLGCYAKGTTIIKNVEHARFKESDRIKAMATELQKMGANIQEKPDGLIIQHSSLKGTMVDGYKDHRIVMSLAIAGLRANGTTEINNAEVTAVSYPGFVETMQNLKANMYLEES